MNILSAQGLSFQGILSYPEIEIQQNIFTFITGKSGCGKSTLLKILNKVVLPTAGTVLYCGNPIAPLPSVAYRRKVLLASQEIFLLDESIQQNFAWYYSNRGERAPSPQLMQECLAACCAPFSPDFSCRTLSGGERQRVFLAICLSFLPNVLLLDEPTSALDEDTACALLENLKQFCCRHSITPVAVCHSAELTQQFADHVICLDEEVRV